MLSLAYPWVLLLALLPLLLRRRTGHPPATEAPALPFSFWFVDLPGTSRSRHNHPRWQTVLLGLAWLLLVTALARPQQLGETLQLPVSGRDLLLVVDISPSMDERDMLVSGRPLSRLEAVKQVLTEFIGRRQGDRLGLLLFASEPYIQVPLTLDGDTVRILLEEAGIGMAGRATAIGDALGLAVKRLRHRPRQQRLAILLTDGANTAGRVTPDQAAALAAAAGVRVYTIGIGAVGTEPTDLPGTLQPNSSRELDEPLLIRIAQQTGGQYFRARSLQELDAVYAGIDQLEPVELEGRHYRPVTELYSWPAGVAVVLWLLVLMKPWRVRRAGHD